MTEVSTPLSPLPVAAVRRLRVVGGAVAQAAVPVLVLVGLAGLALKRWWTSGEAVPLSWVAPPPELVVLLPVVPVVGLLLLGAMAAEPVRAVDARRFRRLAARCAAAAAVVVAAWSVGTVADLYGGGLRGLLGADNLPAVLAASERVTAQVLLVWVLALVAFFGVRVERRGTSGALALLVAGATLAAAPTASVVHGHADTAHTAVHVAVGVELVAVLMWAGLQTAALLERSTVSPGAPQAVACAVLGLTVVIADALRPDVTASVGASVTRGALVLVVVAVGLRHRGRAASMVAPGARCRLVLAAGDGVVALAAVLLASWLPFSG